MINYIVQVLLFQTLFLVVYDLFLKKETFFQWNRFYLLISSVLAYIIPFIKINRLNVYVEKTIELPVVYLNNNAVYLNKTPASIITLNNIYLLGFIVMFAMFLFKIIGIIKKINTNKIIFKAGYKLVILNKENSAFSFFNFIFLSEKIYKKEHQQILNHELIHVKQKHSIDLLLFEIFKIVFWFNPLSYLFQNRITAIHEYIADAKIIASNNKNQFFENLLNQTFKVENLSFVNNYYKQSLLKKRIIMTTKNKSKQILKMKYLLVLPLLLTMLTYTSCSAQVIKKTATNEVNPPPPPPQKVTDANTLPPPPPPPIQVFKQVKNVNFSSVDKTPLFPGCENFTDKKDLQKCFNKSVSSHIAKHFNSKLVNNLGLKAGKKRVVTQFLINKKGGIEDLKIKEINHNKITNVVTKQKTHPKVEKEVRRIINLLPKMKAGEQDGKKVNVKYNLPIVFKIDATPKK